MNRPKRAILSTYYHLTSPLRSVRNFSLAAQGRAPICVGTFHRIADDDANRWTTSCVEFQRAIDWLRLRFDMVSLDEAQQRIRAAENFRPAFALTFDDGYRENSEWALPWLLERNIPLTYFVTSNPVLHGQYFSHDLAMGNRLAANDIAQLRELAAHDLVEIGAHTRSHADLGAIASHGDLFDEVIRSAEELEQALGIPIERFAFPFGQHANLNEIVFELLIDHGFSAVCSAYGGYNFPGDDSFHLQRMCCDGPVIKTKNWASLDPFKQWSISRYEYAQPVPLEVENGTDLIEACEP